MFLLSRDRIRARGLFDADTAWALIDDHMAERADYSEHILAMLMTEIWHRVFIDGVGAKP